MECDGYTFVCISEAWAQCMLTDKQQHQLAASPPPSSHTPVYNESVHDIASKSMERQMHVVCTLFPPLMLGDIFPASRLGKLICYSYTQNWDRDELDCCSLYILFCLCCCWYAQNMFAASFPSKYMWYRFKTTTLDSVTWDRYQKRSKLVIVFYRNSDTIVSGCQVKGCSWESVPYIRPPNSIVIYIMEVYI